MTCALLAAAYLCATDTMLLSHDHYMALGGDLARDERVAECVQRMALLLEGERIPPECPSWPGECPEPEPELTECARADINGDGVVGGPDMTIISNNWGKRCADELD